MRIHERSKKLIGEAKLKALNDAWVLIVGVGGVGGTALECLARSGVSNFVLIDNDVVDESNLNRQILFIFNDIGQSKVQCAKKHILSINPNANIVVIDETFSGHLLKELENYHFDFAIDAIDDIKAKIEFIEMMQDIKCPFLSSLGMGNRLDPTKVKVTKLNKTTSDPLARKLRYYCKERELDLSEIKVVFSDEIPLIKSKTPASMMMVPSAAGLVIANYVINYLTEKVSDNIEEMDKEDFLWQ